MSRPAPGVSSFVFREASRELEMRGIRRLDTRDELMPIIEEGLAGLRVLITGGSRGLGAATARRFVAAGATVLTASRNRPSHSSGETFVEADLSTSQGVAELGRRVMEQMGGVDVLVNNAGAASAPAPTLERSDSSWQADLEMNLLSTVRLDRALVPGMAEPGRGIVVHVSSIASGLPQRADASYAAVKAALNTYSRELAAEVGRHGVRVVCAPPASSSPTAQEPTFGSWLTSKA
jgi:NAD(P)-dependent dehydrogenase (short-subunit alcohol dehydrogenase family)